MYIEKWQCYGVLIVVFTLLILIVYRSSNDISHQKAREILKNFYNDHVPEQIIDRYLLKAGRSIVPHLVVEIQNKDMPRRGYAILALGKIGDRWALPALIHILEDSSEGHYFRHDAYRAIRCMDEKLGDKLAKEYSNKIEGLDQLSEMVRKHPDKDFFSLMQVFNNIFYLITHDPPSKK